MRRLVLVLSVMSATMSAPPARADWMTDMQACYEKKGDLGQVIAACSRALESGLLAPGSQWITFTNRGNVYQDLGQFDRAIADYGQSIRLNPEYSYAYSARSYAYFNKGQFDQAIQDADHAIRLDPGHAYSFVNRGLAYGGKGQLDRAFQDYDQAIHLKPDYVEAFNIRGNALFGRSDYDRAIRDFDRAIALRPDFVEALYNRGNAYIAKGQPDRAIQDYDRAIALRPDHAYAYGNRGGAYWQKGDLVRAESDLRRSTELVPTNQNDRQRLAQVREQLRLAGLAPDPRAGAERGRTAQPERRTAPSDRQRDAAPITNNMAARIRRAQELLSQLAVLEDDQELDPGPPDGRMGQRAVRAVRAFQESRGLKASGLVDDQLLARLEEELRSAVADKAFTGRQLVDPHTVEVPTTPPGPGSLTITIDPGTFQKPLDLLALPDQVAKAEAAAQVRVEERQRQQTASTDGTTCARGAGTDAVVACTREIESGRLQPSERARAMVNRGFAQSSMGNLDEALRDYGAAIQLLPNYAIAYNNRGWAHQQLGDFERALQDYGLAIQHDAKFALAYANRGEIYRIRDDLARALADLDTALVLAPASAGTLLKRGRTHRALGDADKAMADLDAAIRLEPVLAPAVAERGAVFELRGELDKAVKDYQRAVALDAKDETARANLARLEPKLTQLRQAEEQQRAQQLRQRQDEARQAELRRQAEDAERLRLAELAKPDARPPVIEVQAQVESQEVRPKVQGKVQDDRGTVSLMVDGQPVQLDADGGFTLETYLAEGRKRSFALLATDAAGNKASAQVTLTRVPRPLQQGPEIATLDPSRVRAQPQPDAVALIVGIADYEATSKAVFADNDALVFKDYAELALGVSPTNILHLDAGHTDRVGILEAIKSELGARVVPGKSDVFVFFAGHGLTDGQGQRYLLPRNGRPSQRLLEDSALRRERLIDELQALQPRHTTLFLDTCFTGETRDKTALCDGCRLVGVRVAKEPERPGLTIIAAAAEDQVSSALDKAGHGLFSYWLMKGLEGEADLDRDKEITAKEMHAYVNRNVPRLARGLGRDQTPTLEGDGDVVLARLR